MKSKRGDQGRGREREIGEREGRRGGDGSKEIIRCSGSDMWLSSSRCRIKLKECIIPNVHLIP